ARGGRGRVGVRAAWLEPGGGCGPVGVELPATAEGDGGRLSGTKGHVEYAGAADGLLVLARCGAGPDGVLLLLVDPRGDGMTLTAEPTVASDSQCRVDLDAVYAPGDAVVGAPGAGWSAWEQV